MTDETASEPQPKPAQAETTDKTHATVEVDLDAQKLEELATGKEDTSSATSSASHAISATVSGLTFAEFKSKLGTTDFLDSASVTIDPKSATEGAHAAIHADLIKQNWGKIFGGDAITDVSGGMTYKDASGNQLGGDLKIEQDLKFDSITLTAAVDTTIEGGKATATPTVGLKFNF
jgi:hypothetical protein